MVSARKNGSSIGRILKEGVTTLYAFFPSWQPLDYNKNVMTARSFDKINPATGQLLARYSIASPEAVWDVLQKSRTAQTTWGQSALRQRASLLKAIADALYKQANTLADVMCQETGKTQSDALESDLGVAISIMNYYAETGPAVLSPQRITPDLMSILAGRSHREVFHPRGVIGVIAPWNYPLAIPASGIAACLMAGNTVVLKPSELAPQTGERLVELIQGVCQKQGLPVNLVQLVMGDGSTGAALVEGEVDGIIFTGSAAVGRQVAAQSAARHVWCSLELGGSDAMLVLEDCDLECAASYAVWGRFTNAGQACAAVKRLLVPKAHAERFIQLLQCKISQLKVGASDEPGCHFGPLISEQQLTVLEEQVQDALDKGASLVTGGHRLDRSGYFYAPTLLTQVPTDARILNEEVFGPVLPVITYKSVDEAVSIVNQSVYGLTANIFGPARQAEALAHRLHAGTVLINDIGASNYAMSCAPWGGWKQSGQGASHGAHALRELSLRKVVSANERFHWPLLNKPLWLFGKAGISTEDRSKAVLAFANRHPDMLNPKVWLSFWKHRSSTRL